MVNPGFVQPQGQGQAPQQEGNGMAVAGMVLGIISLVFCWFPFLNWILALLGIIFGALGIGKGNRVGKGKGMAIAGLACGVVAAIVGTVIFVAAVQQAKHDLRHF
jgi:hypothetical protein